MLRTNWFPNILAAAAIGFAVTACSSTSAVSPTKNGSNAVPGESVTTSVTPTPAVETSSAAARRPLVRIWFDCSKSTDESVWAYNVDRMIASLEHHRNDISGVEVICFASAGRSIWAELVDLYFWGDPPANDEFTPNFERAPHNAKVFQDAKTRWIDAQRREFMHERSKQTTAYEGRTREALAKLKERLLLPVRTPAACTRFFELAERIAREGRPLNIAVTDGLNDCPGETAERVPAHTFAGRIVIIQVPTRSEAGGRSDTLSSHEAFLQALFPGSKTFPIYLAETAVDDLFK